MPDREKVILGLECCHKRGECRNCPYFSTSYSADVCTRDYLIQDAISLLKAQEPVKPLAEYSVHTGSKWAICGKCHEPLAKASDKEKPNYCSFCGRAVKWNENNRP